METPIVSLREIEPQLVESESLVSLLNQLTKCAQAHSKLIEGNCFTEHATGIPAKQLNIKRANLRFLATRAAHALEIGFNAGHSAAVMLDANPNLHLTCVDVGIHSYVKPCADMLRERYGDRFQLIVQSSEKLLQLGLSLNHFDLIHVDGNHLIEFAANDLFKSLPLAKHDAIIIVDDTQDAKINALVDFVLQSRLFSELYLLPTQLYEHRCLQYKKPKIALVTVALGESYQKVWQEGTRTKMDYCKNLGYDFVYITDVNQITMPNRDVASRPAAWTKIPAMEQTLDKGYDAVCWIDADTFLTGQDVPLEMGFSMIRKQDCVLCSRDGCKNVCTGVFFVWNDPCTRDILEDIWNSTEYMHHFWWENAAFIANAMPKYHARMRIVAMQQGALFNAYPGFNLVFGDWIIHLAGPHLKKLINDERIHQCITTGQLVPFKRFSHVVLLHLFEPITLESCLLDYSSRF